MNRLLYKGDGVGQHLPMNILAGMSVKQYLAGPRLIEACR